MGKECSEYNGESRVELESGLVDEACALFIATADAPAYLELKVHLPGSCTAIIAFMVDEVVDVVHLIISIRIMSEKRGLDRAMIILSVSFIVVFLNLTFVSVIKIVNDEARFLVDHRFRSVEHVQRGSGFVILCCLSSTEVPRYVCCIMTSGLLMTPTWLSDDYDMVISSFKVCGGGVN